MTALARLTNGGRMPGFYNWIEDWFGSDLTQTSVFNTGINMPAVNIRENDESFVVEMAAPGMTKEDFNINLDNNLLTISSEKETERETEGRDNYTRKEFSYTAFTRTFTLPNTVNGEAIAAQYDNGILHLTLPKKEEARRKPPKAIEIK